MDEQRVLKAVVDAGRQRNVPLTAQQKYEKASVEFERWIMVQLTIEQMVEIRIRIEEKRCRKFAN